MNTPKQEKFLLKVLKSAISKDETRPQLCGFYHCEELKALVSSDGYGAVCLRSMYDDQLKNKIINPITFQSVNRDYVKLENFINAVDKKSHREVNFILEKKCIYKSKQIIPVYFLEDGKIAYDKTNLKSDDILFVLDQNKINILCNDDNYLIKYDTNNKCMICSIEREVIQFLFF